jgi:RNA 2',3'-cyclic 3'-phosphodiesterase
MPRLTGQPAVSPPTGGNCPSGLPRPSAALAHPRAAAGKPIRLFVAIAPPPEALDELEALTAPLRAARDDLRWTSREAWHVTLAFLGEVQESELPGLLPRLERAAGRHHDFCLAIAGAGTFPAADRANVLWGGLSGDRRSLANLAASVTAGASRAGATPPDKGRRFEPHLTLARCRLPADVSAIVAALASYQGLPWHADRIHLVRSQLPATAAEPGRAGSRPRYTTVAWWPLRGAESATETAEVRRTG